MAAEASAEEREVDGLLVGEQGERQPQRHAGGERRALAPREHAQAQAAFAEAARRATSIPEQRYLQAQTARLAANNPD